MPSRKNEHEFLHQVFKGDKNAVAFVELLFRASQVIDDLIDKDKPIEDIEIIKAFYDVLFVLPDNKFYIAYHHQLRPLIKAAFIDWLDANVLEKGDEHDKTVSFVLRSSISNIAVHVAHLIGGFEWGCACGPDIRRHMYMDTLKEYLEVT